MYVCMYVCMYMCKYIYICIYIYIYIDVPRLWRSRRSPSTTLRPRGRRPRAADMYTYGIWNEQKTHMAYEIWYTIHDMHDVHDMTYDIWSTFLACFNPALVLSISLARIETLGPWLASTWRRPRTREWRPANAIILRLTCGQHHALDHCCPAVHQGLFFRVILRSLVCTSSNNTTTHADVLVFEGPTFRTSRSKIQVMKQPSSTQ